MDESPMLTEAAILAASDAAETACIEPRIAEAFLAAQDRDALARWITGDTDLTRSQAFEAVDSLLGKVG